MMAGNHEKSQAEAAERIGAPNQLFLLLSFFSIDNELSINPL